MILRIIDLEIATLNIFFTIFLWTYGVIIFKGKVKKQDLVKEILKALKNPSLIAVYMGIVMRLFDLKLPAAAMTSIFADSFNIKKDYAAVFVVETTLLSVFTLTIILRLII